MAHVHTDRLCIYYPVIGGGGKMSGNRAPESIIRLGTRRYIAALDNISFDIAQGQRIGIIGRNGSGKSTLLRALGGIYSPTSGRLETSGKISALFNINLGIQKDATGRENIMIRGLIKGWSRRQILDSMDEIIEFSELKDFIDLPLRTYSDGMRMRLLFAIATNFSPEILLLDEWIGAGDADFQAKAANRMNGLVDKAGITVIASHNHQLLSRVCDQAIWLDKGVIRAMGPVGDVSRKMNAYFKDHPGPV